MLALLTAYFSQRFVTRKDHDTLVQQVQNLSHWMTIVRMTMSKNSEALAALDAQIDELAAYVLSDDETDAAEVNSRVDRLKDVLSQVKGEAPVEEPVDPPADPE